MLDKELYVILEDMTAAEILIEMGFKNPERYFKNPERYFRTDQRVGVNFSKNWGVPAGFTPEYLAAQEELNRIASERLDKLRCRNEERLKKIRLGYCFACGARKKA